MVTLEAAEVEIALLALRRFVDECGAQVTGNYCPNVMGAAAYSTQHCGRKALDIAKRLEQAQQDEREGNNAET